MILYAPDQLVQESFMGNHKLKSFRKFVVNSYNYRIFVIINDGTFCFRSW